MSFWQKRKAWQKGFILGLAIGVASWLGLSAVFYDGYCLVIGELDVYGYHCSYGEFAIKNGGFLAVLLVPLVSTFVGYIVGRIRNG